MKTIVKAHKRRLKSGKRINVRKHIRKSKQIRILNKDKLNKYFKSEFVNDFPPKILLFHWTNWYFLDQIQNEGLQPTLGGTTINSFGENSQKYKDINIRKGVYLSDDPFRWNSLHSGENILLVIDKRNLHQKLIIDREGEIGDYYVKQPISSRDIGIVTLNKYTVIKYEVLV